MLVRLLAIIMLCFLWVACRPAFRTQQAGFRFKNPKQQKTVLPFRLYGNLIVVPVLVNQHKDTLNFAIDTGVSGILVLNPNLDSLFNRYGGQAKVPVRGLGSDEVYWARISALNRLQVGGSIVNMAATVMVMEDVAFNLSPYAGVAIHGLLGYDFFRDFVVKIDYVHRRLVVYSHQYTPWERWLRRYHVDSLWIVQDKPYLRLLIQQEGSPEMQAVYVLLDTGAGHTLLLETAADSSIHLPERHIRGRIGATLVGDWYGSIARLPKATLARWQLNHVLVGYPDTVGYMHRRRLIQSAGAIGYGLLHRFSWILDYRGQRYWLRPNKFFRKKFEYSFTGIDWVALPPDYQLFMAAEVNPASPAWEAGLRPGDILLGINDYAMKDLSLAKIYKIMEVNNQSLSLLIQRGYDLMIIRFRTRRLI